MENKNKESQEIGKKKAFVYGRDLSMSPKDAAAICNAIRGRTTEHSLIMLENVVKKKYAIIMKTESAHHKVGSRSLPSRYPVKASLCFIKLIKSLNANATVKGMTGELIIIKAMANKAAKPFKPTRIAFGRKRFKRSHVLIEAEEREAGKEKTEAKIEAKKKEIKNAEEKVQGHEGDKK